MPKGSFAKALAVAAGLLTGMPICEAREKVPVFTFSGAPKEAAGEPTASPGDASRVIPPPRIIPSQDGGAAVDSYKDGSEKPENWPFTINLTSTIGCTGTLIGPQVLLTAAHCVQRMRVFDLSAGAQLVPNKAPQVMLIRTTCEAHPRYRPLGPLSRVDFALCYLATPFPERVEIETDESRRMGVKTLSYPVKFQRLSLSPRDVGWRQKLFLAGFGCSSSTSVRIDGKIRAGLATLSGLSELSLSLGGYGRRDSSTLCKGDSGGAVYRLASTKDPYGPRLVVGVNSASIVIQGRSFVARTSSAAFQQFFNRWRARWKMPPVCGIDKSIEERCHDRAVR